MSAASSDENNGRTDLSGIGSLPLVIRSTVTSGLTYIEYRQELRSDFFYSCGYCSLSEFEAQGLAFQIDHYVPQSTRPDLKNDYNNLIYSCDECNRVKSDVNPPEDAVNNGIGFYRPDRDIWDDHFAVAGIRLKHKTILGDFSINALELNRQSLRRLRDIRNRLSSANEHVSNGLLGLRRFRIDQLPVAVRGRAVSAIGHVTKNAEQFGNEVDFVLKAAAKSPLLDPDPEKIENNSARKSYISKLQILYPGNWRGRSGKRTTQ